jgi:hypothetical protein
MHFLHHRLELVTLVDDGAESSRLFGEVWGFAWFDADRIFGEQLLLRGFELALPAKFSKTGGDLLRFHDSAPVMGLMSGIG